MKKVVDLPTTPGGSIFFKETEITSISDMIMKWEEQEKSDVNKLEGKRVSRGRRVSEPGVGVTTVFEISRNVQHSSDPE